MGGSFVRCWVTWHDYDSWAASYLLEGELLTRMCRRCCHVEAIWL